MKNIGRVILWIIGLYLIGRAIIEPFVIDLTDPSTYHLDWGGPHLAGVLAVHCGPGVLAAFLLARSLLTRRRNRTPSSKEASSEGGSGQAIPASTYPGTRPASSHDQHEI